MTNYEVKLLQFSGPLGKLLELIEEKKLEITTINLAEVTADFLKYAKSLEKSAPSLIADFIVVAAKLVLIKSKVLLPMLELSKEEEEDIKDLEGRLRIYREFKVASEHIKKLWDKNSPAHARPLFLNMGGRGHLPAGRQVFYPPENLKLGDLARAINNLAAVLKILLPEEQTVRRTVVTIEQKIEELLNRLQAAGQHSFRTMSEQKTRNEVIVLFLAILHLLKDRLINVEQGDRFSDIVIQKQNV